MNLKIYVRKRYLHHLNCLSAQLDLLVSPAIEIEATCDLNCYVIIDAIKFIDYLLEMDEEYHLFGDVAQSILCQLKKKLREFGHYDRYNEIQGYEKGFFETQEWLDLVSFASAVNDLLKDKIQELNAINSDDVRGTEGQFNLIAQLCDDLDFYASTDIEEEIVCTLDCCMWNVTSCYIDDIFALQFDVPQLGEVECNALYQLREALHSICYDDQKEGFSKAEGFSKTQRWLDFVVILNTTNALLKDAIKRHKVAAERVAE